jgi:hypothetical protein
MLNVIVLLTKVRPVLSASLTGSKHKLSPSVIKLSAKETYGKEKIQLQAFLTTGTDGDD